jgi:biopolymer transport protein TolR
MALGAGSNGGELSPSANINVTPLVDVMLVLLVIFMVTAPMLQQGVEVDLPKTASTPLKGSAEQVVISIDKNGQLFLGSGNPLTLEELPKKVALVLESKVASERKVYIKGDRGLSYGVIMKVMATLYQGGITQIGLVSSPEERG